MRRAQRSAGAREPGAPATSRYLQRQVPYSSLLEETRPELCFFSLVANYCATQEIGRALSPLPAR
jgi:hypothetical protein